MKKLLGVVAIALLGCDGQSSSVLLAPAEFVVNPSGRVPLAAIVTFASDLALDSSIEISDGTNEWGANFGTEIVEGDRYTIPVLGMRPSREHVITITLKADGETEHTQQFAHVTPDLPGPLKFPQLDVKVARPDRMEPGVTFLSIRRRALGRGHWLTKKQYDWSTKYGLLAAIDTNGEVVWWYEADSRTSGIAKLSNGNIMMHRFDSATTEIDLLGFAVGQYYAEDRPFPPPESENAIAIRGQTTLHHQPHQMPNGDFLAFSANPYLFEDWYSSESDPDAPRADTMVMADTVVQFNAQGEQVWSWNTLDHLDKERIGRDTFWSYWWTRGFDQHMDWTHANGLSYDKRDGTVLVSLRNQSAVLKVDPKTNEIKWILGNHRNWSDDLKDKLLEPIGDITWPAYQHNPRVTHKGTVILFDNRGWGGAMAFEEPLPLVDSFSRGAEFEIDEENMTVRQIWTSGDSKTNDSCFTHAMSDAWRLPVTDNRLVIHAFCVPTLPGITIDIMDETRRSIDDLPYGGRILEFAGDEVVFRMEVGDEYELFQWNVYGGFRSANIYHDPDAFEAH